MKNIRAALRRTFSVNRTEKDGGDPASAGAAGTTVNVDASSGSFISEGAASDHLEESPRSPAVPAPASNLHVSSLQKPHVQTPAVKQQPQQHSYNSQASGATANNDNHRAVPNSVTIGVARHCPPALMRAKWCLEDFELKKQMYQGQISVVYHAIDLHSGISVALKLYRRSKLNEMERHQVAREIKLHLELNHSGIIALYAAWKDRNYVYMAMEFAATGDVYTFVRSREGKLTEDVAVPLMLEPFLSAITYIHALGLIHRDIKPENILMTASFDIKISDFGLSIDSKQEIANTRLGTIDYLAPEILDCPVKNHPLDNKDKPSIGYDNKVDCWSIGVLAYEVLTGKPPFEAFNAQETLRLIKTKTVEYPSYLSPGAIDFIQSALVRDPAQRMSVGELLHHPWIRVFMSRREASVRRAASRRGLRRSMTMYSGSEEVPEASKAPANTGDLSQLQAQMAALRTNSQTEASGAKPANRLKANRSFNIKEKQQEA